MWESGSVCEWVWYCVREYGTVWEYIVGYVREYGSVWDGVYACDRYNWKGSWFDQTGILTSSLIMIIQHSRVDFCKVGLATIRYRQYSNVPKLNNSPDWTATWRRKGLWRADSRTTAESAPELTPAGVVSLTSLVLPQQVKTGNCWEWIGTRERWRPQEEASLKLVHYYTSSHTLLYSTLTVLYSLTYSTMLSDIHSDTYMEKEYDSVSIWV